MSISTYTELKTAVDNWLDDTTLSSRVPEFITLGESRINADLGTLRTAWTSTTLTGTPSSRSIALPSGFVEPRALFLTTYSDQQKLNPFINGTRELSTTDGIPSEWCIAGTNIDLDCPCDQAHTFLFHYRAKWDIAADSTNWLLTNHPDVYLAASLIEAWDFRQYPENVARWEGKYEAARERAEQNAARSLAVAQLAVDAALQPAGNHFNFTIG